MAHKSLGLLKLISGLLIGGALLGLTTRPASAQEPGGLVVTGKAEFKEYCAQCHGLEATGDGPLAGSLTKKPANLTLLAKNNGGVFPDKDVRAYIDGSKTIEPHGTREMPVWGHAFRASSHTGAGASTEFAPAQVQKRIDLLVAYIKTLQQK